MSYSYYLDQAALEELHKKILEENTVTWREVDYLKGFSLKDIYAYLLLPDVDKLSLADEEKQFVKENLNTLAQDIRQRINTIVNFFTNYNRVYTKYKHIFSAMVGTYAIEQNQERPRIFARDYHKDKITKKVGRATYVIPSTLYALDYYEKLKDDISTVFLSLLEAHTQSLYNLGKPFLIPDIYLLSPDKKTYWMQISQKVNFSTVGRAEFILKINVGQKYIQSMLNALAKDFIYKIDEDILEHKLNKTEIESIT